MSKSPTLRPASRRRVSTSRAKPSPLFSIPPKILGNKLLGELRILLRLANPANLRPPARSARSKPRAPTRKP